MQSLYILHLDRHHLGDDLFLNSLAQQFSSAGSAAPASLLVHGSGEKVERTLEAQGQFVERTDGLLDVESHEHRRLVERAVRETNQEIVAALTDEVVSTVGIQGVDRGLFQRDEEGTLHAQNAGWVSALVKQHVVPVVSALVEAGEGVPAEEVRGAEAVTALAHALDASFDPVACVFATGEAAGVCDDSGVVLEEASYGEAVEEAVPHPHTVRALSDADIPVLVTNLQGLFAEGGPQGTRIGS